MDYFVKKGESLGICAGQITNVEYRLKSISADYCLIAEEQRNKGNYKESIKNYLISILNDRNNILSYIGIAESLKKLQRYDKAVLNLKCAEKLNPYSADIKKELALCHIITGNYAEGVQYLMQAIKLVPRNINFQMQLALVHQMMEEDEMALMIYQKIIETNPDYIRAYIQKAALYMHIEDYLNSAKMFHKVLKLNPNYYRAYLALGICYEKLMNYKSAKRFYRKYLNHSDKALYSIDVAVRLTELKTKTATVKSNLKIVY